MNSALFGQLKAREVIENTLAKLESVGEAIMENSTQLSEAEDATAKALLSDITTKTLLLNDALRVVDKITQEEAIEMTHELIAESLSIYSHFE